MCGACWTWEDAEKALRSARSIVLASEGSFADRSDHALVVEEENGRRSLFETDPESVEAFRKTLT